MWSVSETPPKTFDAPGFSEPGVRALFYEGPSWQGKPTRVFAWLGLPERRAGERVPAMVLVHGGGGSAFAEWVRLWTARGYAAIAMDTCGHTPDSGSHRRDHHALGGPPGWGVYEKALEPPTEQWMYHAVEAVLRGHTLLRSLPEVDPKRIGLTGVSWGGVIIGNALGYDHRFRFAAPIYGCGFLRESPALGLPAAAAPLQERWDSLWDPSRHLAKARCPLLWINGTNDFAFTPPLWQRSHRLPRGPKTLSFQLRMPHGHGGPSEKPEELRLYAEHHCRGGAPLPRAKALQMTSGALHAEWHDAATIGRVELLYTRAASGAWPDRLWEVAPADWDGRRAHALLPADTVAAFLQAHDRRGAVVSTEVYFR